MNMQRRHFLKQGITAGTATLMASTTFAINEKEKKHQPHDPAFHLNYAFHDGMFKHHAGDDFMDQIKFGYSKGFRSVEDNGMRGRSEQEQKKIGDTLEKLGMTMGVFVSHDISWQKPYLSSGDKEIREQFLSQIRTSVEVAKRCGARWMVAVPGVVTPGLDLAYQKVHVMESLRRAADILLPHNLVLLLEPLNFRDHPGQLLPDVPNLYQMVKSVNSPACKLLFDVYHVQIHSGNIIPNMDLSWDEIPYIQLGDNPGRKEPTTGEINFKNIFQHVYNKGFKGLLGMEHGISKPGKEGELALIEAYKNCDSFL